MTSYLLFFILTFFVTSSVTGLAFAEEEILIASWNMLRYSDAKASYDEHREAIVSILLGGNYDKEGEPGRNYDIIFLQEIVSNGRPIKILCQDLEIYNYTCKSSPQIKGDGTRPELYTVIYKNNLKVTVQDTREHDVSPTILQGEDYFQNQMVRPPMKAIVTLEDGTEFIVFNNHIKPSAVPEELEVLQEKIEAQLDIDSQNIIVLGDLNAGGSTLSGGFENFDYLFNGNDGWNNIFSDNEHTTFAKKTKSYDRMIATESIYQYYTGEKGIIGNFSNGDSFGEKDWGGRGLISDHKLIWAEFSIPSPVSEDSTEIYLTPKELEDLSIVGVISVVISGIVYEIKVRRET